MRPDVVVVAAQGFDHNARFLAAPDLFERQALFAELAVKALTSAVSPWIAKVT